MADRPMDSDPLLRKMQMSRVVCYEYSLFYLKKSAVIVKMHLKYEFLLEMFFYFHIFTYLCNCLRSR